MFFVSEEYVDMRSPEQPKGDSHWINGREREKCKTIGRDVFIRWKLRMVREA